MRKSADLNAAGINMIPADSTCLPALFNRPPQPSVAARPKVGPLQLAAGAKRNGSAVCRRERNPGALRAWHRGCLERAEHSHPQNLVSFVIPSDERQPLAIG